MTLSVPDYLSPHRRYNPLSGEWVLISAQRTQRPWRGGVESSAPRVFRGIEHDPDCFLCPRNRRAGGELNPDYPGTFTFANDYPALIPMESPLAESTSPLFTAQETSGICRVMCFSPNHSLSLGQLDTRAVRSVVDMWAQQTKDLGDDYQSVQVFENRGEAMGASSSHPHGQVWASSSLPTHVAKESLQQKTYSEAEGSNLLVDYAASESLESSRLILENDHWLACVPYWATWPFETIILPKRHILRLPELTAEERNALAELLKRLLTRYDNLFDTPFPYSMGWHGAPFDDRPNDHWQLHAHLYPPLLRSASVRKFMVGYELLAESQRDLTPEHAARQLRELPETPNRDA
jgi:UDPglucose--hexose-1-phosphate uridylyltransferase